MGDERLLVVGGGLAGARAAEGARQAGHTGPITIVAGEDAMPYIRPPLSKEFLTGAAERDVVDVFPADWYADERVEVLRGVRATGLDPAAHRLRLADGRTLDYGRLLLATGASARRWRAPEGELAGVHVLRTFADSEALRSALAVGGRRMVAIGAGWIGLEATAAARGYADEVTVIAPEAVPLAAAVGSAVGEVFAELHRANGVDLRMSTGVAGIRGEGGRVTGVELDTGETVPADLVLVGIGAVPETGLAEAAGLEVRGGIVTDASFRTSADDVYAVGDVASVYHPVLQSHLRVEHWANAENAGRAAGRSLAGEGVEYAEIPYFYTDQYDLGMEYSGYGTLADGIDPVFRGDRAAREFLAFWQREGRVVAGMNVNVWDVNDQVQQLIRSGARIDPARLADASVPLERLVAEASA
ncbi:FAD-dependent oxidoreductase [Agromyces sp. H3Y2-19a]|jgi:3-phenylpropionate/trans-cinnamate dioxygenase ferredoxin reductase subunit|uniref:NAD(P)/FAD-dependent oxidoreductase n=1 Tax=Agromyces TaxID=33877 RepID=UPI001E377FD3|nr:MULTISPECIES: FAD-dependent oxidoreductase [Agromyces]MCD5346434.1 FAD-dependent oxidoreductase [Agromyces sp. S2-1-8]MDF0512798.1 FAD-dependent oxidoreductase [Agromyces chromiiresistens]